MVQFFTEVWWCFVRNYSNLWGWLSSILDLQCFVQLPQSSLNIYPRADTTYWLRCMQKMKHLPEAEVLKRMDVFTVIFIVTVSTAINTSSTPHVGSRDFIENWLHWLLTIWNSSNGDFCLKFSSSTLALVLVSIKKKGGGWEGAEKTEKCLTVCRYLASIYVVYLRIWTLVAVPGGSGVCTGPVPFLPAPCQWSI